MSKPVTQINKKRFAHGHRAATRQGKMKAVYNAPNRSKSLRSIGRISRTFSTSTAFYCRCDHL